MRLEMIEILFVALCGTVPSARTRNIWLVELQLALFCLLARIVALVVHLQLDILLSLFFFQIDVADSKFLSFLRIFSIEFLLLSDSRQWLLLGNLW